MQLQAMIHASDNALHFVHAQLDVFGDMSRAGDNQSYDPIENANDHVWIKENMKVRKRLYCELWKERKRANITLKQNICWI